MSFSITHTAESSSSSSSPQPCLQFTVFEIERATRNLNESLVIGRGGFGKVYRATVACGKKNLDVAIKRLESTSSQGANEFWAEVEMLSKLRHSHLVSLIGYCNERQEMILVYEYLPNGTLFDQLHKRRAPLTWVRRLKICIGAARGLDYLHDDKNIKPIVIHRDIKSSNILLTFNWEAKISDFGLSKISPTNQSFSYVNTLVRGTFGYLDPEYFYTGRLTRKSDVYAFGVVLFEALCGKQAVDRSIDEEHWGLATWAQDSVKEGRLKHIVDSKLEGRISPKCLKEFALLACQCLHSHPKHCPTMAEVATSLESILALQEKNNSQLVPMDIKIFGRKVSTFLMPSNQNDLVGGTSLKSLDAYLYTIGGEDRIVHRFDFSTIVLATENFSEANKLSSDKSKSMYKGRLQNGQGITVYGPSSNTGYQEYMNEASILVKIEHENVVQLLGYCIDGTNVYLLYDFAPYATLDTILSDPMCNLLDYSKRYKIVLSVAKILAYLHNHAPIRIIHGDVKPTNILLDESLDPKLSGFGLATPIDKSDCIRIDMFRGTLGYMAPEYNLTSRPSTKSEVFSFGVLVLETATGKRVQDKNFMLIDDVLANWLEGTLSNMIDPRIDVHSTLVTKFVEIGLLCVQSNQSFRPTMDEVVGMLLGTSSSLSFRVSQMRARIVGSSNYDLT